MHQDPYLLVTRPVEPHLDCRATDAAVHLGNRNGSLRLALDFIEQPVRDPRREGEHAVRIACSSKRGCAGFVPKLQRTGK
jgi:hypothetical protein